MKHASCGALWRALAAEAIGTAFLVFLGCCSMVAGGLIEAALAFGCVSGTIVSVAGETSGAHLNPAVSLCGVVAGRLQPLTGLGYVAAQLIGALLGYAPIWALVDGAEASVLRPTVSSGTAVLLEVIMTSLLTLLCCSVWEQAAAGRIDTSAPLKFALLISGLILCGGPLSGAAMNPARALASAAWHGSWEKQWVYWVGPLLGGVLAAFLHCSILSMEPSGRKIIKDAADSHLEDDTAGQC